MLEFKIKLGEAESIPNWDESTGRFGDGYIKFYKHRSLEYLQVNCTEERKSLFICREMVFTFSTVYAQQRYRYPLIVDSHDYKELFEATKKWPLGFVILQIKCTAQIEVEIVRGAYTGTAFYVSTYDDYIQGNWDVEALCDTTPHLWLNTERIAGLLRISWPYDTETIFKNVHRLPERVTCVAIKNDGTAANIKMRKPSPLPYMMPGSPKETDDIVEQFSNSLGTTIRAWISDDYECVGAELSGGLDSTNIVLALRKVWHGKINSYGIDTGEGCDNDFHKKRSTLINLTDCHDTVIDGLSYIPLPDQRATPVWPEAHIYIEPVKYELARAHQDGNEIIFTGIGGDELMTLLQSEGSDQPTDSQPMPPINFLTSNYDASFAPDLETWPRGAVASSSLSTVECCSAEYLREGIWPVHPFAVSSLVDFCRSLPVQWRWNRDLMRQTILRAGINEDYFSTKGAGSFLKMFLEATPGIIEIARKLAPNSILVDCGIVNREKLFQVCEEIYPEKGDLTPLSLFLFVRTELFLRKHIRKLRFN